MGIPAPVVVLDALVAVREHVPDAREVVAGIVPVLVNK